MFRKKAKKESAKATLASVKKEMAESRMAKSRPGRGPEARRCAARAKSNRGETKVPDEEWIKTLEGGRRVKFTNQELPRDGAFITAQLAGNKVVYSVVLTKVKNPLSREEVESHFEGEFSKK